jgi:hypothetical protein
MIAEKLGISNGSVQTSLKEDLNMRKLCATIVPKVLSDEQKQGRVDCCNDWIESAQDPHFHERVITGDEAWIYEYDPETKRQSAEWKHLGSPRTKKVRKSRSKIKTMLIVFFDICGVVHHEYVPAGQTINAQFCVEVLKCLRERVRPELWAENTWIMHQDNAPSQTALVTREFLAKNEITTMGHPPPIHLIWHCVTSTCSLKRKILCGVNILWMLIPSNDEAPKGTDKEEHAALL